jgi:tRNA A-37 threonylcarbamoyl transferase component Bud32
MEPSREQRLDAAAAEYLEAAEAGRAPEHAAFLARHPDLAEDLAGFLDDRARFARAADAVRPPAPEGETLPLAPASAGAEPLRTFGDYEILEEIARGGMGVVYKARQLRLNRVVALKMILAGRLASEADVARFRQEAEAAAHLDHSNILPIYEVGEHQGQHFFSMKLIEGGSLAARTAELAARPRDAAALAARLARAVHFAHQRGVLHRDLKPANVLLDPDGTPYVADFGLAKRTEGDSGLTRTGAVVGTPSYISPEQARAEKQLTTAADVYSLGAILYELLSGQPPFRGGTALDTILQVLDREPDDPRALNPRADRDLSAIALKCLQKAPEHRYESAAALAEDLERWLNGEPTRARPPSLAGQAWRWLKRNAAAAAGVVALGTAAGLAAILALFAGQAGQELFLCPPGLGLLHPLRWIELLDHNPSFRYAVFAAAAVLAVGVGWLVRLAARPRTPQAALAAAAATGLIATLVAFSILGPVFGSESDRIHPFHVHPISEPGVLPAQARGEGDLSPEEAEYLAQYLPEEERPPGAPGRREGLEHLRLRALNANRFSNAISLGWTVLVILLGFFLGLTLESTWAADYLLRSGRGPLSCAVCYLELYPPAAALLLWGLSGFLALWINSALGFPIRDGATWGHLLTPLVLLAGWVGLAYSGVIRRWRPAARVAVHLLALGVLAAYVFWASRG